MTRVSFPTTVAATLALAGVMAVLTFIGSLTAAGLDVAGVDDIAIVDKALTAAITGGIPVIAAGLERARRALVDVLGPGSDGGES